MKNEKIQILDCTIRDGSYLINYQFTAEDTFVIARALVEAGIGRIEVGHGVGLDAQYAGKGRAAQSDTEYIRAAKDAVGDRAKVGCFFIPGIGSLDSIREAADAGLDFIRIGTNIVDYREAEEPIRLARELGLEVWSNLMKSYLVGPEEFARIGREVAGFGAQVVVLVDSAGGFTPDNVRDYAEAASAEVPVLLGFHGHNNLQLAIANCLAFAKSGGAFLDGSLRGMGRSAGNAATELLCALLAREGYDLGGIDWRRLMRIAQEMIASLMPRDIGLLPVEIAAGLKFFHTSFMPVVDESSREAGVSAHETILELEESDRKVVTPEAARKAAERAREHRPPRAGGASLSRRWVLRRSCDTLEDLKKTLRVLSSKTGYETVITIARPRMKGIEAVRIAPVRVGGHYCVAHVESPSRRHDRELLEMFAEEVRLWMADRAITPPEEIPQGGIWLAYDDDRLIAEAACDFLEFHGIRSGIFIPAGRERIVELVRVMLGEVAGGGAYRAALALSQSVPLQAADLKDIGDGGLILAAQPGTMTEDAVAEARRRGIEVWRLDMQETLLAEVMKLFDGYRRLGVHAGRVRLGDFYVVAGGVVGAPGDVVVNSIVAPTTILGKADGRGGIQPMESGDESRRRAVLEWMSARGAGF